MEVGLDVAVLAHPVADLGGGPRRPHGQSRRFFLPIRDEAMRQYRLVENEQPDDLYRE